MSQEAELHLLKNRLKELEEVVDIIDRGASKKEIALRDKFAMAALSAVIEYHYHPATAAASAAEAAYEYADAMMVARLQKQVDNKIASE